MSHPCAIESATASHDREIDADRACAIEIERRQCDERFRANQRDLIECAWDDRAAKFQMPWQKQMVARLNEFIETLVDETIEQDVKQEYGS